MSATGNRHHAALDSARKALARHRRKRLKTERELWAEEYRLQIAEGAALKDAVKAIDAGLWSVDVVKVTKFAGLIREAIARERRA